MPLLRPRSARPGRRFGWRDALAYARAIPNMAWPRDARISWRSLSGISALDPRLLPRQRWFVAADGGQIAWRSYDSSGAAHLVLIHGSACFGDQFDRLARDIAAAGLAQVHTLDMRGHGASDQAGGCPDRFALDIGEFVAALRRDGGQLPVVLGGHSAGGGLVLNALAGGFVPAAAGALLFAPFLGIASPTVRPLFGGWLKRVRLLRLAGAVLANLAGVTRWNRLTVAEFNPEASLHDLRYAREWSFATVAGFGPGPAAQDRVRLAALPVMLIAGDRDECFRAELYPREIARLAPAADCIVLPGLGHWDVLTDRAALDACAQWLGKLVPTAEGRSIDEGLERHARIA
jgi:alpha-beta hydrolase superfamily lysophospholipase